MLVAETDRSGLPRPAPRPGAQRLRGASRAGDSSAERGRTAPRRLTEPGRGAGFWLSSRALKPLKESYREFPTRTHV